MNTPLLNTNFVTSPRMDVEGFELIQPFIRLVTWERFAIPSTQTEIRERVMSFHKEQGEHIARHVRDVRTLWEKKAGSFIQLALKYFLPEDIPKKVYTCYPTVWPLIARDPERGYVSFPITGDAESACAVLAHEFLHELFFHHVHRVYGDTRHLGSKAIWDISEVFNVLMLSTEEWQKVFPFVVKEYAEHQELLQTLKPVWEQSDSLDAFIDIALRQCGGSSA